MGIREVVKRYISEIQSVSKVISEVDMLQSFSIVSEANKYVRPSIVSEKVIKMKDCRHPVLRRL